jgi:hypothetical protein
LFHDRDTAMGMDAIGRLKPGVTLAQAKATWAESPPGLRRPIRKRMSAWE